MAMTTITVGDLFGSRQAHEAPYRLWQTRLRTTPEIAERLMAASGQGACFLMRAASWTALMESTETAGTELDMRPIAILSTVWRLVASTRGQQGSLDRGIQQGCPLSLAAFGCILLPVLEKVEAMFPKVHTGAFADDLSLWSHNHVQLQLALNGWRSIFEHLVLWPMRRKRMLRVWTRIQP